MGYKISEDLIPKKMSDEKRKELIQKIKSYRCVNDAVLYTLALLPNEKFPCSYSKIHTSFHRLREEYPDLFSDLFFDTNGHVPYSEKLDEIFFFFGVSGILEWTYLPAVYIFNKKTKKAALDHLSDKFSEDEKKILSEVSKRLQDVLLS